MPETKLSSLVTGSAFVIGRSTAIELAKTSTRLLFWDVDASGLETTVAEIQSSMLICAVISDVVDVVDAGAVRRAFTKAKAEDPSAYSRVAAIAGTVRTHSLQAQDVAAAALVMGVNDSSVVIVLQMAYQDLVLQKRIRSGHRFRRELHGRIIPAFLHS